MADTLRRLCTDATRAFLRKDYATCLQNIQQGIEAAEPTHHASDAWLEQLLVLRFTVVYTVYINATERKRVLDALNHVPKLHTLLEMQPAALYMRLWYECLYLMSHKPLPDTCPSTLEPSEDTCNMILHLSGPVLSSAILMALRMDMCEDAANRQASASASLCARQTCECYFAAVLREGTPSRSNSGTYERIMRLYVAQVLGSHLGEWDYARDFVEYSSLPAPTKTALVQELTQLRADVDVRAQRESDVLKRAQQQYADEMARRSISTPASSSVPPSRAPDTPEHTIEAPNTLIMPTDAPHSRTSVQRQPSIHGRPKENMEAATSSAKSHAKQRAHLQSYLQRRPLTESLSASSDSSAPASQATYVLHILSNTFTRQRLLSILLFCLVIAFAYRRAVPSVQRRTFAPGNMSILQLLRQRVWDTLRMYVF